MKTDNPIYILIEHEFFGGTPTGHQWVIGTYKNAKVARDNYEAMESRKYMTLMAVPFNSTWVGDVPNPSFCRTLACNLGLLPNFGSKPKDAPADIELNTELLKDGR